MSWVVRKDKAASHDRRKPKKKTQTKRRAVSQTPAPADKNTAPSTSKRVSVRISNIVIGERLRKLNKATVMVIAESMREVGQVSPIWVRKIRTKDAKTGEVSTVPKIIAGVHRVEAKKMLGEKMIDAVYMDVDEQCALLLEISENLDRGELTVLERAEHIDKKVQLIRARRKAAQTASTGGRQPGDKAFSAAALELGHTRDDIRRSSRIAGMSDVAKEKARELDLDDNQSALLKIAKKEPNEQVAVAEQLAPKKKGAKKAAKKGGTASKKDEESYAKLVDAWADANEFQEAFRVATENARRKFISMLQRIRSRLADGEDAGREVEDADEQDEQDDQDEQDEGGGDEDEDAEED
jgi:ParB-like chromosome segregation protein Spo0J